MVKHTPARGQNDGAYRAADGRWRPPRPEGLARVLAKAGYGARPRAEALVRSGRVEVDGRAVTDPGVSVTLSSDIRLDGAPLREAPRRYLAVHKPAGVESQLGCGGLRALERLLPPDAVGLEPAGRLDARSAGLLLVSNDLRWNQHVCESENLERRYEVLVRGHMRSGVLDVVQAGISLPSQGAFRPDRVELLGREGEDVRLLVVLRGDHARKVRVAFASLRFDVVSLSRVGIGPVSLATVVRGRARDLTAEERHLLAP
ncbi:MAG: S4 domain-containing protein [Candidatus Krumholzibacteriia bacterium]